MIVSLLEHGDSLYINMHAEQVYASLVLRSPAGMVLPNYPIDSENKFEKRGVYQHSLFEFTLGRGFRDIFNGNKKNVFLDFSEIYSFAPNAAKRLIDLIVLWNIKFKNVIIHNVQGNLFNQLAEISSSNDALNAIQILEIEDDAWCFCSSDVEPSEQFRTSIQNKMIAHDVFILKLSEEIKRVTVKNEVTRLSSRVKLDKYINIKELIHNQSFFCYCVYMFSRKLIDKKFLSDNYEDNINKAFFVHTMCGSSIGSLLAQLLCLDLVFVDHLGPLNKLYNVDLKNKIRKNVDYIVVADVVCLGTELSNAKSILTFLGAKYIGCAAFVNIKTVGDGEDPLNICALYCVDENNNRIDYVIKTDLCKNCSFYKKHHLRGRV